MSGVYRFTVRSRRGSRLRVGLTGSSEFRHPDIVSRMAAGARTLRPWRERRDLLASPT